jgi:cytochrome c556
MNKLTQSLVAGLTLAAITGTALAQAKPEDLIRFRQAGYRFMAWNMGKIKANIDGQYNKDQVIAAANVVAAIANSGMGALYAPGTDKGTGFHETHVKPELFTDKEGVGKVAKAFNMEANEMAKVAATGDAAAVKAQFGKLGETCKGCHDKFRKED